MSGSPAGEPAPKAQRPRPVRSRSAALRLLRYGVAAAILAFIFSRVPAGDVAEAMAGAAPLWLVAAVAVGLAGQWLVAVRLKRLTDAHGLALSTAGVLEINLATLFYGLFLPGGNVTGIAIRLIKLSRAQRHLAGAAVALLFDRVLATATLLLMGMAFWLLEWPTGQWPAMALMTGALAVLAAALAVSTGEARVPFAARARRALGRLAGARLSSVREAFRDIRRLRPGTLRVVLAASLAAHLVSVASWVMLAAALGLELSVVSLGWLRSATILVTMIPISASGLGLREGAMLLLLREYGTPADEAVAFSLLVFAATVLPPGLIGGALEARRLL